VKAEQGVADTKGAAAEGKGIASRSWAKGEHLFDCRICGELWINGKFFSSVPVQMRAGFLLKGFQNGERSKYEFHL
jgi:hypothetical protein